MNYNDNFFLLQIFDFGRSVIFKEKYGLKNIDFTDVLTAFEIMFFGFELVNL